MIILFYHKTCEKSTLSVEFSAILFENKKRVALNLPIPPNFRFILRYCLPNTSFVDYPNPLIVFPQISQDVP